MTDRKRVRRGGSLQDGWLFTPEHTGERTDVIAVWQFHLQHTGAIGLATLSSQYSGDYSSHPLNADLLTPE